MLSPSLDSHGSFFLRQLLSPSCIQASSIFLVRSLPDHSLPPGLLQNQVLAFDFLPLLRWHGVVAPQSLLAFALFEGLVFSHGLETGDSLVVSLAATGPYLFYAVHGRILSGSIPPLVFQIFGGVSFLFLHWRVHDSTRTIAVSRRRPMHVILGTDSGVWFFWPRLAAPAAVGR